ncbi:hypothetical protein BBO_00939 [Beauveria brongniartii RCEF 3172]|uniref:Uncharacterized protein n=1 Tax=Beauveria brongniartii RCEF 3172 TaxID=1081107 RepID=A0A167JYZ0_9HYPO|nr:hypothetical protein BBO_00939 [Beauveria brongniartii RCEF 3172]
MKFLALPLVAAAALFTASSAAPVITQEVTVNKLMPLPTPIHHIAGQPDESRAQDAEPITTIKYGRAETQGMPDRCIWKNGNWHCPFIGHGQR